LVGDKRAFGLIVNRQQVSTERLAFLLKMKHLKITQA